MAGGYDGDITLKLNAGPVTAMPAATRQAARRVLTRLAPDDHDLLLDMLGLDGPEPHVVRPTEREEGAAARPTAAAARANRARNHA